jgi:hypothetical protein
MTDTVALPTFDALCAFVRATLCERDSLDASTTPFVRTPLRRRDELWGYAFHVEGPRLLRTSAIWSAVDDKIFVYNSTGERVQELALSESPPMQLAKAA